MNTTLAPEAPYKASGIKDAMNKLIVDATLKNCGLKNVDYVFLYSPAGVDDKTRKIYLDSVYNKGKEI